MSTQPPATTVTWAINGRVLLAATDRHATVYRAAAPDWREDHLSPLPEHMTWIDLRTPSEYRDLHVVPATWRHVPIDLTPDAALDVTTRVSLGLGPDASHANGAIDLNDPRIRAAIEEFTGGTLGSGALDLSRFYRRTIEQRADGFAAAITSIARATTDVVIACSAGRDRTGLVSAMILELSGASRDAIIDDFVATNSAVAWLNATLPAEVRGSIDLSVAPEHLIPALDELAARGGARTYLLDAGVEPADLDVFATASSKAGSTLQPMASARIDGAPTETR